MTTLLVDMIISRTKKMMVEHRPIPMIGSMMMATVSNNNNNDIMDTMAVEMKVQANMIPIPEEEEDPKKGSIRPNRNLITEAVVTRTTTINKNSKGTMIRPTMAMIITATILIQNNRMMDTIVLAEEGLVEDPAEDGTTLVMAGAITITERGIASGVDNLLEETSTCQCSYKLSNRHEPIVLCQFERWHCDFVLIDAQRMKQTRDPTFVPVTPKAPAAQGDRVAVNTSSMGVTIVVRHQRIHDSLFCSYGKMYKGLGCPLCP